MYKPDPQASYPSLALIMLKIKEPNPVTPYETRIFLVCSEILKANR